MSVLIKQGKKKRPKYNDETVYNRQATEKQPLTIYVDELWQVRLWRHNNQILAKQLTDNKNAKTDAGLYLVGDTDYRPAEHVDREFEVAVLPDDLYYKDNWFVGTKWRTDDASMEWKTDIDIEVGDKVWCEYLEALEAPIVMCKGERYRLLKYERLFVAIRSGEAYPVDAKAYNPTQIEQIICLNGYCLLTEIDETLNTTLVTLPTKDSKRLKVEYVGKPNQEYRLRSDGKRKVEHDDVRPGDIVVVNTKYRIKLEGDVHQKFDKPYIVMQRHNMDCVIE